jgi:anti-sigma regulatory factor (Ser/Thr protein kinase)
MCWGTSKSFSGDRLPPAHGRQFCVEQLRAVLADRPGRDELLFDLSVVVSELLTNSLRAGAHVTRLSLSLHRDTLRVMVDDDAPGTPTMRTAEVRDANGRGMAIVAALSSAWAIETLIPGKQVWADLDVDPELTSDLPSCNRPIRFHVDVSPDRLADVADITPATLANPNTNEGTNIGPAAAGATDPG